MPSFSLPNEFANVPVMWEPTDDTNNLRIVQFWKYINKKYSQKIDNYWDLHQWSIQNVAQFWAEMWDYIEIIHSKSYDEVTDLSVNMADAPIWFKGARLNYAENILKYRDNHIAIISDGEDKSTKTYTYAQLYAEACRYGAAMKKLGLKENDAVVCFMSNREEAIFAMLGATAAGATWSGALPLNGAKAVIKRFEQVNPKFLFTVDRFVYDKEEKNMLDKLQEISQALPSLKKIIIVPSKPSSANKDISNIRNSCFLEEFLAYGLKHDGTVPELEFKQLSFNHPVVISYTSGTTGDPKALVHGPGCLLSLCRDFWLHGNADRNYIWLSTSPVGWASWTLFTTLLSRGVTLVVYDGVPFFLSPTSLWDMVDKYRITNLFLTASCLDDLEKKGYLPTEKNHLSSLRVLMSGASVVKLQNYDFVYKKIKSDIMFGSAYGSTELMGACMLFDRSLPVYRGEISAPVLGVDVRCFNDSGKSVIGEVGELVIRTPSPAFPLSILHDRDGSKYRNTYFSKFPGVFAPGDICLINPVTRGVIVYGRRRALLKVLKRKVNTKPNHESADHSEIGNIPNYQRRMVAIIVDFANVPKEEKFRQEQMSDDTLKPRGARFGSSEIYNIVNVFPEVRDSLCVSQYNGLGDERAVLFLKMRHGCLFTDELVCHVRKAIERELSAAHVPEIILEVKDIPYNMNGKKMEIIVKKIINKMPYNPETVTNEECLSLYEDIPELRDFK